MGVLTVRGRSRRDRASGSQAALSGATLGAIPAATPSGERARSAKGLGEGRAERIGAARPRGSGGAGGSARAIRATPVREATVGGGYRRRRRADREGTRRSARAASRRGGESSRQYAGGEVQALAAQNGFTREI